MSSKIDPRQVLSYLNQLGYTNIDAHQLQAFIKDLKKLVKFEERQANEAQVIKLNILTESNPFLDKYRQNEIDGSIPMENEVKSTQSEIISTVAEKENIPNKKNLPKRPSTAPLRSSSTSSTRESTRPSSHSIESRSNTTIACPVHCIGCPGGPRTKSALTSCTCPINVKPKRGRISCAKDKDQKGKRPACTTWQNKTDAKSTCSYPDSFDKGTYYSEYCPRKPTKNAPAFGKFTHDFAHPCYCPGSMRPRSAVIKCNIGCKPGIQKCDPVNLHKYYQRQWEINPIPGENMLKDQKFRWCFREKISCGPPVKK